MNTSTLCFLIQLKSKNYILYDEIKMVPKTYSNLSFAFESQRAVQQMKANHYGKNISGLSLKQEVPVMVKPRLLELLYVCIWGLSLNEKWR